MIEIMLLQYMLPSLLLTGVFTLSGRIFVYGGSMFDPAVAPGIAFLAAGDLMFIGAVLTGLIANAVHMWRGPRAGRATMYTLLALMFLAMGFLPRG
jgi:hypothetical protein